MNALTRFLIRCSGEQLDQLKQYPSEQSKYAGIGGTILFTAILAGVAGGFAFHQVFHLDAENNTVPWVIPASLSFGLLWGLMIFNLDRFIVVSMRKSGSFWRQFATALPRLLLATVLSITISMPLEVKIFEGRIKPILLENRMADVQNKIRMDSLFVAESKLRSDSLIYVKSDLLNKKAREDQVPQNDPLTLKFSLQYQQKIDQSLELQGDHSLIAGQIRDLRQKEDLTPPERKRLNKLEEESKVVLEKIKTQNEECEKHRQVLNDHLEKIRSQEIDFEISHSRQVAYLDSLIANQERDIEKKTFNLAKTKTLAEANNLSSFNDSLVPQIEAYFTLLTREKGLWWMAFIIALVFWFLETAPVLVKLLSSKGMIDLIKDGQFKLEQEAQNDERNWGKKAREEASKEIFAKAQENRKKREQLREEILDELHNTFWTRLKKHDMAMQERLWDEAQKIRKQQADNMMGNFANGKLSWAAFASKFKARFLINSLKKVKPLKKVPKRGTTMKESLKRTWPFLVFPNLIWAVLFLPYYTPVESLFGYKDGSDEVNSMRVIGMIFQAMMTMFMFISITSKSDPSLDEFISHD